MSMLLVYQVDTVATYLVNLDSLNNIGTAIYIKVYDILLQMSAVKISAVCVLLSLCVHCQSQEIPHVRFMGNVLMNHSYVNLSLVGTSDNNRVSCHTNWDGCCSNTQGLGRGDWFFPNGTRLNHSYYGGDIYEARVAQRVSLLRRNNGNVSGIYHCNIAISGGSNGIIYTGLYDDRGKFMLFDNNM